MTRETLKTIAYDPYKLIDGTIDLVTQTGNNLVDPSNPFLLGLELDTLIHTNALVEMTSTYRKIYPSLATTIEEVHPYMSDDLAVNMFATPGSIRMQLNVNFNDLISYGVKDNSRADIYKASIPERTMITIGDLDFTILNQIDITVDKLSSFVEELPSSFPTIDGRNKFISSGVINSVITTDGEGNKWVSFITNIRQLTLQTFTDTILSDEIYAKTIPLKDQYFTINSSLNINGKNIVLHKTHSDEIINLDKPTLLLKAIGKTLNVTIPNINHYNRDISGELVLDVYTTRGKVVIPLNNKSPDEFTITLPKATNSISAAVMKNINIVANTDDVLDGGVNLRSFKDVKKKIIFNSSGYMNSPITDKQLLETGRLNGFRINKVLDNITQRLYIANKNISDIGANLNSSVNLNVFGGTLTFITAEYLDSPDVVIKGTKVLLKSSAIFKYNQGTLTAYNKTEKDTFLNMVNVEKIKYLNTHDTMTSPYYYLVDIYNDVLNHRVFHFDQPVVNTRNIIDKNGSSLVNVNVDAYVITKITNGYLFKFTLKGNSNFNDIKNTVNVRVGILNTDNLPIFIDAVYNPIDSTYSLEILTDVIATPKGVITITNSVGNSGSSDISLNILADLYIYTNDINPTVDGYYTSVDLGLPDIITAYTRETFNITLGTELTYMWSKVKGGFTGRKFLKHTTSKLARYKANVYELDSTGCPVLNQTPTANCSVYDPIVLHATHDVVKDSLGNDVYEYKVGDNVLDGNGKPIIDTIGGTIRYMDLLLLDYKVNISKDISLKDQLSTIKLRINKWLTYDLVDLNNSTLEQTTIQYKPSITLGNILTTTNESMPSGCRPKITLYINKVDISVLPNNYMLVSNIGKILHKYLGKQVIILNNIRKEVILYLNNVVKSVKIEGITTDNREVVNTTPSSSKMYIKTKLDLSNNLLYDIEVNIHVLD